MRFAAALALAGLLAGVAGPCPLMARCADRSRSPGHQCCCGTGDQCQCQLGARNARPAARTVATEPALPAAASDDSCVLVAAGGCTLASDGSSSATTSARAVASLMPGTPVHLELPVYRC